MSRADPAVFTAVFNMDDDFDDDMTFEEDLDNLDDSDNIQSDNFKIDRPYDEFTVEDAFFLGAMMGFSYDEGLDERHRRDREKEDLETDDIFDLEKKDEI